MEGRYPSSHAATEFVKLEDLNYSSIPDREAPWTDAELLLLLEGLEMFDENWNSISDHVGTRTREECVMKFLQLEIEDKYLDSETDGTAGAGNFGALNHGRVPFTQSDNPIMSVVGFLAAMSDPSIAAAAAGKSVDEMRRGLRSRIENGIGGTSSKDALDKGKAKEGMKNEDHDSMDVDNNIDNTNTPPPNQLTTTTTDAPNPSLPTIALATSAARASALASHEERSMTRLVASAVNTTLSKLDLKLHQFSEMESVLQAERRELEKARQQLFLDRLAFKKRVGELQEGLMRATTASARGLDGEEGRRLLGEVLEHVGGSGAGAMEKLGFRSVQGRAEEDLKPLSSLAGGGGEGGVRTFEM